MSDLEVIDAFEDTLPAEPGRWSAQVRRFAPALVVLVGGLAMWELIVTAFSVPEILLPKPSSIIAALAETKDDVVSSGWATLREAVLGFLLGTALGIGVAVIAARWENVRAGLLPFAIAANSAPIIALAPISNQWFGATSLLSKVAVVAIVVFFPVMINTVRGLIEVKPRELELMRSYAAPQRDVVLRVRVPNALPFLFSALKVGAALSIIAAIVAEYFGGPRNTLGVYITQHASLGLLPEAWAAVLLGIAIGLGFYLIVTFTERLVMPWHVSVRASEI